MTGRHTESPPMREERLENMIGLSTPDPPLPDSPLPPLDVPRATTALDALWEAEGEAEVARAHRRVVRLGEPILSHLAPIVRDGSFEKAARAMNAIAAIRPEGSEVARDAFSRTLSRHPSTSVTALRRAALEGDAGTPLEEALARAIAKDALVWLSLLRAEGWGVPDAWTGCHSDGGIECRRARATIEGVRASRALLERCASNEALELLRGGIGSQVEAPATCSTLDDARIAAVRHLHELDWETDRRLGLEVIHAEGMRCRATVSSPFGHVKIVPAWSRRGSHLRLEESSNAGDSQWPGERVVEVSVNTGFSMISVQMAQADGGWRAVRSDPRWLQFCL
ncbi:MAG: hypothetical protein JJ863_35255 [Deltaproteobacteria bacterium]|nr:hypothetical protein [Deltaproteobacteria bacterium]